MGDEFLQFQMPAFNFAEQVKRHLSANVDVAVAKFTILLALIWPAFTGAEGKATKSQERQEILYNWHALRTKADFVAKCNAVFSFCKELPPVIFIQTFGRVLIELIMQKREAVPLVEEEHRPRQLSVSEENALRYVGGFIVSKLHRKLTSYISEDICKKLVSAMTAGSDKATKLDYSKEWTTKQSRGGLIFINDATFLFFRKLEEHVFHNMPKTTTELRGKDIRVPMQVSALQDGELSNKWSNITRGVLPAAVSRDVFKCIVDFYIQIRGHSFASVIVEKFKQGEKSHQKGTKGLRSTLKQKSGDKIQSN